MKTSHTSFFHACFIFLSVLAAVPFLFPCPLSAAETASRPKNPEKKTADPLFSVNGYVSGRYVYRAAQMPGENVSDQDVFGELRLDVTMPKENRYEFHFFGTARKDVDGSINPRTFSPFEDIGDAYKSGMAGYLYEAHVDVNRLLPYVTQVRVGRQTGTRDEPVFFDGLAADINIGPKLNLAAYGGVAVHLYEVDYKWGSDTLGGAGLDYAPFKSTLVSLDYLSVNDERALFETSDHHDQLVSFKVWQRITSFLKALAKVRFIDGEGRDMNVRALGAFPDADAEASISYFRQFRTQNELSTELSSFYDVLGQSRPYQSYDLKVRKLFGERYAVDLGYFQRSLIESADQNAFNREFTRMFADFEVSDIIYDGVSLTFIGERWESKDREFNSAGLDAGYTFKKKLKGARINAGTYYSLYKYDYYVELGERTDVRTYYVNGKAPLGRGFSVNGSYEYESAIEHYQTVKLGMRYDF